LLGTAKSSVVNRWGKVLAAATGPGRIITLGNADCDSAPNPPINWVHFSVNGGGKKLTLGKLR